MDKAKLQALRELCEKATEGEWEVITTCYDESGYEEFVKRQEIVVKKDDSIFVLARIDWSNPVTANAELMSTARTAIPELLTALEEAEERIKELEVNYQQEYNNANLWHGYWEQAQSLLDKAEDGFGKVKMRAALYADEGSPQVQALAEDIIDIADFWLSAIQARKEKE